MYRSALTNLLLVYATLIGAAMPCPTNCNCKWKGGKQTVDCVNKSMITVPDGMDSGTQVLDFSGNDLKSLGRDQFQRLNLVNLQKVYLSRCRLSRLDDQSFRGLTNLVELDLSNNILPAVPVEVFADLPSLMKLNLNGNPLTTIKGYTFKNLKYLISLELSRCEIQLIERDAFYGLAALELLRLDFNLLQFIPGANTIPRRLHAIHLQHNPWSCDCRLADLYTWLNVTNLPQTLEPVCERPTRLKGAPIKLLDVQELACVPDVSPTSLYLEIPEGKNVSLMCRVNAVPNARVSWRFQDRVLQNDSTMAAGIHLNYYVEEGTSEKRSELFIFNTNTEDNGTFVCTAENQAGKAQSNYTIRIVLRDEMSTRNRNLSPEYAVGVCVAVAAVTVLLLTCALSRWLRYRAKRRRRRKKEKNKKLALYNDANTMSDSPIIGNGESHSAISETSTRKANGNSIFVSEQSASKLPPPVSEADGIAAVSHMFHPCNVFASVRNPDLISDAASGTPKMLAGDVRQRQPPDDPTYASIPAQQNQACSSNGISIPTSLGVHSVPFAFCMDQFRPQNIRSPVTDSTVINAYPNDYGLPKVATHFSAVLPATAFYRTLPHKRQNAASSKLAAAAKYTRDAELLSRSAQPACYEHFLGGDIRYNVEGYPKDSAAYTYTPVVSFSDTVQVLGKPETGVHRCKGVQTESQRRHEHLGLEEADSKTGGEGVADVKLKTVSGKYTNDSPDEGYVGECADATDV